MTETGPGHGDAPDERIEPRAVVLTQVASAEGLAAACAMGGVPVDAVPTPIGSVAVCREVGTGAPEQVASVVSRLLPHSPAVLLVQRDGRLTATRWSAGQQGEEVAAALLLDGAPPQVEELLLGTTTAAEQPGTVTSVGLSRWRATRVLARAARAGRVAARAAARDGRRS